LSIITFYEILNGLLYKDAHRQLENFKNFVKCSKVLPLTTSSAELAAQIYADLRKQHQQLSHNDVLIASIAMINDLVLITNNTSHFSRIKDLEIDNWTI
jgi:tRNA(fMet)-specific endonuclease VapC